MPSLEQFLVVSAAFFCIGLYGVLSRRNVVAVLMSLELMFNGVNLAAVAFSRFVLPGPLSVGGIAAAALTGQVFALFIVAVAAAEVALGLALVLALYRQRGTIDVTEVNLMQR